MDAYEVKVNIDIFKYQEKAKVISQFHRFFSFFNSLLEFASLPLNNCKNTLECLRPLECKSHAKRFCGPQTLFAWDLDSTQQKRKQQKGDMSKQWPSKKLIVYNFQTLVTMTTADNLYHQQDEYAKLKENTVASGRIEIVEMLASGQFGKVYKGM